VNKYVLSRCLKQFVLLVGSGIKSGSEFQTNFCRGEKLVEAYTHTHLTALCPGLPGWVSLYQKGKTNQDFTEATDSEWQWHHLGHMQV